MKRVNITDFTPEDYLIAKHVCDGSSSAEQDLAFFNVFFPNMVDYISKNYNIRKDPDQNQRGEDAQKQFKIMMLIDGEMTSITIGDFIFHSLRSWNPETAQYLTYIHKLLIDYKNCVPVSRTEKQQESRRQLIYAVKVILSKHPEITVEWDNFDSLLKLVCKYMPEEYSEKKQMWLNTYNSTLSLNRVINEDDEDSPSLSETISYHYKEYEELPASIQNPFSIIDSAYASFKKAKLQTRTQERIRLYMTVQLIFATLENNYLTFDDFRELSKKYPDFIVDVDWIEQIYSINTANNPDYAFSTRLPTQKQQAEHLKVDYHSYCNSIRDYKKITKGDF